MAGNTFGHILTLTTFGESHGPSVGGIVDGVPAGLELNEEDIQKELDLRKPGMGPASTTRKELDLIHLQSGVYQGKTIGTPIAFLILNNNTRSQDYDSLKEIFRPGHADYSYWKKYLGHRDHRGGGRSSGRETAARVAAGAIAGKIISHHGISLQAATIELGSVEVPLNSRDFTASMSRPYFAASNEIVHVWDELVRKAKEDQDTLGGIVEIRAQNVPAGLGEPVFDKLSALLAHAMMSVGAVKGVEIGDGFACARVRGSENNDRLLPPDKNEINPKFATNHAGGILGGISSGQDIVVRCAIKPIASIPKPQQTVDIHGRCRELIIEGRHDLSAIPRIVPVLKAMAALVLADTLLMQERMYACIKEHGALL